MAVAENGQCVSRSVDEVMFKIYKTSFTAPNSQRLPKSWNIRDRSRYLRLSQFYLTATYSGGFAERHDANLDQHEPASSRSDVHIPLNTGIYYFEVTIANKHNDGRQIAVGVSTKASSLLKLPGYEHSSFGYHNDGLVYHGSPNSKNDFGPRFADNDTIGCGVDFLTKGLFFTRNGILLGKAFEGKIPASPGTRIFPTVGLQGRGTRVTANFGQRPFRFAFDAHVQRERGLHENRLVGRICTEEFAGSKMRELISGYLVHHGYVATTQAFSRWSNISSPPLHSASCAEVSAAAVSPVAPTEQPTVSNDTASSCSLPVSPAHPVGLTDKVCPTNATSTAVGMPRSHSEDALPRHSDESTWNQIPGVASMLHRKQLRALCRRCQYGRAAAKLSRLYPQVLERCPELIIQLRCRQLIEMMRRHAIRRGGTSLPTPSTVCPQGNKTSNNGQALYRSGRNQCCLTNRQFPSVGSVAPIVNNSDSGVSLPMDVDHCQTASGSNKKRSSSSDTSHQPNSTGLDSHPDQVVSCGRIDANAECEQDTRSMSRDDDSCDDDDDGFGLAEDTGVSLTSLSSVRSSSSLVDGKSPAAAVEHQSCQLMEVDGDDDQANGCSNESTETACLLRHVQFGRALVNLVKQVRCKTGGLSFETEQLLQQSVSLLAYPSPASMECPLRSLLDPMWRETVASFINSAVLKAHNLPTQPALEDGLRSLQKCFQDSYFVEAQTLGHFLLYHLTPDQLDRAERLIAVIQQADVSNAANKIGTNRNTMGDAGSNGTSYQPVTKRQRISATDLQEAKQQNAKPDPGSNGYRPDGETSHDQSARERRSPRRRRATAFRVTATAVVSAAGSPGNTEAGFTTSSSSSSSSTSSSSMDEVLNLECDDGAAEHDDDDEDKEDDEEEDDEDVDDESCHVDDLHGGDDEDDGRGRGVGRGAGQRQTSATTRSQTRQQSGNRGTGVAGDQTSSPNGRSVSGMRPFGMHLVNNVLQSAETAQRLQRSHHFIVSRVSHDAVDGQSRPYILTTMPPTSSSFSSNIQSPLLVRHRYSVMRPLNMDTNCTSAAPPTVTSTVRLGGESLNTAFSDLLSLAQPQHVEFLTALDDALKAYTNSTSGLGDEASSTSAIHRSIRRSGNDDPPPGSGAGSRLV